MTRQERAALIAERDARRVVLETQRAINLERDRPEMVDLCDAALAKLDAVYAVMLATPTTRVLAVARLHDAVVRYEDAERAVDAQIRELQRRNHELSVALADGVPPSRPTKSVH